MPKVLDSFAILAWMQGNEPSAPVVDAGMVARKLATSAAWCRSAKAGAGEQAADFRRDVRRRAFPLTVVPANNARVGQAATIRARPAVAYADAFAVALAQGPDDASRSRVSGAGEAGPRRARKDRAPRLRAPVITGDPEILALRGDLAVEVEPLAR